MGHETLWIIKCWKIINLTHKFIFHYHVQTFHTIFLLLSSLISTTPILTTITIFLQLSSHSKGVTRC
ncbi:hypothetical protein Hdeb2414_s0017g00512661 [Helianthus debilis subsp. tardiflorus]